MLVVFVAAGLTITLAGLRATASIVGPTFHSLVNVVVQSIIQPRYVGDTVGLAPTITMLSVVFWGWALGPLGALLAVPLSLMMRGPAHRG